MARKRNPKGTVAIEERGNTLTLRWRTQGRQFRLALGLPNSPAGKKLAKAKALEIQKDLAFGDFDPSLRKYRPDAVANTLSTPEQFEKFIESRLADGTSGQTIAAKYRPLLNHLTRFGQDIVSDSDARDFVAVLRNRQSPRVANQNLTLLKGFGTWSRDSGYLDLNPYENIKPLKDSREPVQNREPFSLTEIQQIFAAFNSTPKLAHYHDFTLFLLSLGLRPSEAIGLRWSHVDLAKNTVTIRETLARSSDGKTAGYARERKSTKTGNSRILPLSPLLTQTLVERWVLGTDTDSLIFTTPTGRPIDDRVFRERIWTRACKIAGVPYRPPYTARHTLLSHGIEFKGWTLPQAAQIAGHANTRQIAETYGHALETPEFPEFQ